MSAVAVVALIVLAACGSGASEVEEDVTRVSVMSDAAEQATSAAASGGTPEAAAETISDEEPAAAAQTLEIASNDIFFEPTEVTIPADTDVQVTLPNHGAAPHNFSIDALGIDVDIVPGASEQVVINAPAGEYEFYCNVPGHKEAGMVGTLIVSAEAAAAPAAASPAGEEAASPAAAPQPAAEEAAAPVAAAEPVEVVSHDIYFDPAEVTIPADTDVTISLPNEGVTPHNFSIDALGIDVDIAPGATEEVVINAPAGEYEFYCNVPGHKAAGMVGTLIVSAEAPTGAGGASAEAAASPATQVAATPAAATPAAGSSVAATAAASPATATSGQAAQRVEITANDIFFEPDQVTIPADTDVTVALPNNGVTLHNFSIDALGINVNIAPGVTEEVVINAPAGEYEFYCNIPGHKAAGMVGTLIVSADAAASADATPAAATPSVTSSAAASPSASPAAATPETAIEAQAAPESLEVISHDIYFEPDELIIPADTDVAVSLPNEGVTPHNFSIDALGIDVDIAPGATEETVINAPAGEYEYYCNIPGHKAAGMVGTLKVE